MYVYQVLCKYFGVESITLGSWIFYYNQMVGKQPQHGKDDGLLELEKSSKILSVTLSQDQTYPLTIEVRTVSG